MKKLISILLVSVLFVASFALTASAENFVPSIGVKPAPDIDYDDGNGEGGAGDGGDDDGIIIGHVVDKNGNILSDEYHDCIVITPVSEAKTSTRIPKEAADLLLAVYDEISAEGYKLSSMSDALNKMVAADLGEGKNADDLVVKDLFDVTVLCEELETLLAVEGNVITLKFNVSVKAELPVYVMTYTDGKWEPIVKTVNNGDGTISCTFEHFCPVAFFVPIDKQSDDDGSGNGGSNDGDSDQPDTSDGSDAGDSDQSGTSDDSSDGDTPQTGDSSNKTFWAIVMCGSIFVAIALVIVSRRSIQTNAN